MKILHRAFDGLIRFADLLISSREESNGTILAQTGDGVSGEVYSPDAELWGPIGYIARPSGPTPGAACQAVSLSQSDRDVCIGYRDVRTQAKGGSVKPGEVGIYAGGPTGEGQARFLIKDDGTVSSVSMMTTEDNAEGGKGIIVTITSEKTIMIQNADKGGIAIESDGKITMMNTTCGITLGTDGTLDLSGKVIRIGGQQVMLGMGATPATACVTSVTQAPLIGVAPGVPIGTAKGSGSVFVAP